MNKKQLGLQNASLFAEIERKAKEIEILNIRLEESENKAKILNKDIYSLKESLDNSLSKEKILSGENEQLKTEIAELKRTNEELKNTLVQKENEHLSKVDLSDFTHNVPTTQEVFNEDMADDINADDEEIVTETLTPPSTEEEDDELLNSEVKKGAPINDMIRDYSATLIGKVTRVTAQTLSKINAVGGDAAESLKTLALGKNESLKFQIMELAARGGNPEKIKKKMNLLAEEAIVYLQSI